MNLIEFLKYFLTSPGLSRLRVFLSWTVICAIPTLGIYVTTVKYQTFIPNLSDQNDLVYLGAMIGGSALVPILFTITNGLANYHEIFSKVISYLYFVFAIKDKEELGKELGIEKTEDLFHDYNSAKALLGFLVLEFIIIGWDVFLYFSFNSITGLGLFGFISDNLIIGAFIFIIEASNVIWRGVKAFPQIHQLKTKG